uniref:tRNA selenocysteine 1 associated protein 1 n=1 Tax=Mus musculus TaxID=10090 RepID=E9PYW1_MOUSE
MAASLWMGDDLDVVGHAFNPSTLEAAVENPSWLLLCGIRRFGHSREVFA